VALNVFTTENPPKVAKGSRLCTSSSTLFAVVELEE
jgi:hypothetical protein